MLVLIGGKELEDRLGKIAIGIGYRCCGDPIKRVVEDERSLDKGLRTRSSGRNGVWGGWIGLRLVELESWGVVSSYMC